MFNFLPPPRPRVDSHEQIDQHIFLLIERWCEYNETPLSVRMICEQAGNLSTSTVHRSLTRLTESGYIRRDAQGVLRLTDKRWKG